MRRFEFVDGGSSKFWQVERSGTTLNIAFGRIGTNGQAQDKGHASEAAAQAALDKLVKEKTGKGYVEVGATKPAASAAGAAPKAAAKVGAKPADSKAAAGPLPQAVDAGGGYGLAIEQGKLVAYKDGNALAAIPKSLKDGALVEQLNAAIEMLEAHAQSCVETVESWMLRSLATPRGVIEAVLPDEAWRAALLHAVVIPIGGKGKNTDVVGLLAGVDAKKGLGVIDLDGETQWIDAPSVMFPHPVLLAELDDLRALVSELGVSQGVAQLFREVFTRDGRTIEQGATEVTEFENGTFSMLQQAFAVAKKNGYRVSGGSAIVRVWESARVVEARYFLGDSDPMDETQTGALGWVDDKQKTLAVEDVPAIAFSEGMRMAATIYAKRKVDKGEDDDV